MKEGVIMNIKPEKNCGDALYPTIEAIQISKKSGARGVALFAAAMMTVGLAGCFPDEGSSRSGGSDDFRDKFKWPTASTSPTLAGDVYVPESSESRSGRDNIPTIVTSDVVSPGIVFFTEPTTAGVMIPTEDTALAGDVIGTDPTLAGSIVAPTESFPAETRPTPTDEPILAGEIYLPEAE